MSTQMRNPVINRFIGQIGVILLRGESIELSSESDAFALFDSRASADDICVEARLEAGSDGVGRQAFLDELFFEKLRGLELLETGFRVLVDVTPQSEEFFHWD